MTLNGASVTDARRRDTRKAQEASAKVRAAQAAERRVLKDFVPDLDLLSPATVADLAEMLLARCVEKLDDATLLDLTEQLLVECERRGLPVPEL